MKIIKRFAGLAPLVLAAAGLAMPAPASASAHITIVNADGPNEGFNDPTPVAPVGGNPGTTKGQQRLIAFQFAADLWGAALDSNIDIQIQASFDPLGANVLGAAAAAFSIRNFNNVAAPGFPGGDANTNYHIALADKRSGVDLLAAFGLTAATPEIIAQFSSDFDFYLGLDNNHGTKNDLVVVLLHEFGHGLGFSSFMGGAQLVAFWTAVAAYMALVVGIGAWNYRRTSKEEGFLVAGRSLGPVVGGATLMANQVSAGATIGIVGFHYYSGFSYAWSWPLTWAGWMVCAFFVAPKIRRHAGFTLPDYFAARYDSRAARGIAALFILVAYTVMVLRPFKVGDFVTAAGVSGTVKEIGLFVTAINTADNVLTMVGNNKVFSESIQNFTANPFRRVDLKAQLNGSVDPGQAAQILKERIARIPNVLVSPAVDVEILEFNFAGPVLVVRPYCHNDNYWQVYFDTNKAIREAFGAAGFPAAEQQLVIRNRP